MLLRYVLLFLNVFMAASVELHELELGWDPRHQHGPHIGGTYGILSPKHAGDGVVSHHIYRPFVVVYHWKNENMYRVVRMDELEAPGGRFAMEFFGWHEQMKSGAGRVLQSLYIFPHERYEVKGDPEIMRKWPWNFMIMDEDGLERLISAINGFVDGWDTRHQRWPRKGGIYWLSPRYLGLKPGVHIPCVILTTSGQDTCRVVRMDKLEAAGAQPAKEFLGNAVKLETSDVIIDHTTFYIFPRETHEIRANPKIMQVWNWHFITMPAEGLERLIAASDGLVDGWIGSHGPQVRGVYWMLVRYLGIKPIIMRPHIPCVVIGVDGKKCRAACMFLGPPKGGKSATKFFGNISHFETYKGTVELRSYYFLPNTIHELQADPKIMQTWYGKHLTVMPPDGMQELENLIAVSKPVTIIGKGLGSY